MLTFYKYKNNRRNLIILILIPFVVVMIGLSAEYSSADVKEFFDTGVNFRVDVVKLLNVAKVRWVLKAGSIPTRCVKCGGM